MAGDNLSSLLPTNISKTLSRINPPKGFGKQIVNKELQKLKASLLGKVEQIKNEIEIVIAKTQDLVNNHTETLIELDNKFQPKPPSKPTLSYEEYQIAVNNENESFKLETIQLKTELTLLQQKIKDIITDPYKKIKEKYINTKLKVDTYKKRNKDKGVKEKKRLNFKVLKNLAKDITPTMALQGTKLIFKIILNNKKLQDLVDDTNDIIYNALTKEDIDKARIVRNSTLSILNDNEVKFQSLFNLISTLNTVISILNIILQLSKIVLVIATPSPLPDVITPPKEKFRAKYEKVVKLADGINLILALFQEILSAQLDDLNDLKNSLLTINDLLDNEAVDKLSDEELQLLIENVKALTSSTSDNQLSPTGNNQTGNNFVDGNQIDNNLIGNNQTLNNLNNNNQNGDNLTGTNQVNTNQTSLVDDILRQSSQRSLQDIEYKGFKLKIKEEETLGAQKSLIIRGTVKRRYAVAIDKDGVEVLKSALSFTLDPNDLIEQLKLIIDQQSSQA